VSTRIVDALEAPGYGSSDVAGGGRGWGGSGFHAGDGHLGRSVNPAAQERGNAFVADGAVCWARTVKVGLERRSPPAALYFLVAALLLLSLPAARAESRTSTQAGTILISREGEPPGTTGRGYAPAISADGRFVAYPDGSVVLVRDLRAGTAVVASRASGPDGAVGEQPFGTYTATPSISADGRFVAFASAAQNLVPDDGPQPDVFIRDLLTDTTILASRASGSDGAPANYWSGFPSISADGRFVAFTSRATNLDPDDTELEPPPAAGYDEGLDVFVRDLVTGTTTLVSRASGPAGADGNRLSGSPSISADGRLVAFQSYATNLAPGDADLRADIYVRDLQTATTIFVGRGPAESRRKGMLEDASAPSISADGQSVAFSTFVHFDVKPVEYWKYVVFVRDLLKRTTTRVGDGTSPSLSASGRYLAFSGASDLQPYLTAPFPDIFVFDLVAHRTTLASRAFGRVGTPGNGGAHHPSISADGRYVVFESRASNMHPQDPDRSGDVYLRDLGPPPFDEPPARSCAGRRATVIVLPGSSWRFGGTAAQDVVVGSRASDGIAGGLGRDRLCGRGGRDRLVGGPGRDRINGGAAADIVKSADNSADLVDCGPGRDRAIIDPRDRVHECERVRVRQ
jgi:Tol biopolymer transport system component